MVVERCTANGATKATYKAEEEREREEIRKRFWSEKKRIKKKWGSAELNE